jgi:hypothetical protein
MAWAVGLAAASVVGGYLGAVAADTSVPGMIGVVSGLLFAAAVLVAPRHGLVSKAARRMLLRLRIGREDILANLYRVSEGHPPRGDMPAGLVAAVAERQLRRGGLISDGPSLTDAGRHRAREVVAAHRLWETYLDRNLALPVDHLHDPAERLEHYIGPELMREMSDALDRPDADPHGKEIPGAL